MPNGHEELLVRVEDLTQHFPDYLRCFEQHYRMRGFSGFAAHAWTISRAMSIRDPFIAVNDPAYIEGLRDTILSWYGVRQSLIVGLQDFHKALGAIFNLHLLNVQHLGGSALPCDDNVRNSLWHVISNLALTTKMPRLVSGSKTLHHLFWRLVPPIDRTFTGRFLFGSNGLINTQFDPRHEETTFHLAFRVFSLIAYQVRLADFVGTHHWHTSSTKVLDNAIVGYLWHHNMV